MQEASRAAEKAQRKQAKLRRMLSKPTWQKFALLWCYRGLLVITGAALVRIHPGDGAAQLSLPRTSRSSFRLLPLLDLMLSGLYDEVSSYFANIDFKPSRGPTRASFPRDAVRSLAMFFLFRATTLSPQPFGHVKKAGALPYYRGAERSVG